MKKTSQTPSKVALVAQPQKEASPVRRFRIARMPLSGRPHLIVSVKDS